MAKSMPPYACRVESARISAYLGPAAAADNVNTGFYRAEYPTTSSALSFFCNDYSSALLESLKLDRSFSLVPDHEVYRKPTSDFTEIVSQRDYTSRAPGFLSAF
jgi:hypothetical protein